MNTKPHKKIISALTVLTLISSFIFGSGPFFSFTKKEALAATETKWASSHITGNCTNPNNALGATDGVWAGDINASVSCNSRYAMEDTLGAITGTQTISVIFRKGSNSGFTSVEIELYENGAFVQPIVGETEITSTTGQTVSGAFNASAITDPNLVEIIIWVYGTAGPNRNSSQFDSIEWTVNLATTNEITVGTTGTQTANMGVPSTDQYVGGAFTFVRTNATADVTAITITDTGTVNANANLSNVKLFYKTEVSCSASIPGDATAFNATGVGFNASEKAVITGDAAMTVGTSQICVYVQLDVGAGASDGQTLEIEISDPSTEVTVSAGSVSPSAVVAIAGTTTFVTPTFTSFGMPYLHTSANWGAVDFYLEVYMRKTTGTAYARLYNETDATAVASSQLSTVSATFVRLRTDAVTLIDGKVYRVQFGKIGADAGEALGAKLIGI